MVAAKSTNSQRPNRNNSVIPDLVMVLMVLMVLMVSRKSTRPNFLREGVRLGLSQKTPPQDSTLCVQPAVVCLCGGPKVPLSQEILGESALASLLIDGW